MGTELADFKREMRKEIRELKASLEHMNQDVEDFRKECADLKKENAALRAINGEMADELRQLKKTANENSLRITAQEQYSRRNNIEIKGIPQIENEKLVDILAKVGDVVREPITEEDVQVYHRVPTRNTTTHKNEPGEGDDERQQGKTGLGSNIVVVFNNRAKRDAILEKAKKMRFESDILGFSEKEPVFLNEHLCPKMKKLLGLTIGKKHEMNWRFAWVKNGRVYARQSETSRVIRIDCEADLGKIRNAVPAPLSAQ